MFNLKHLDYLTAFDDLRSVVSAASVLVGQFPQVIPAFDTVVHDLFTVFWTRSLDAVQQLVADFKAALTQFKTTYDAGSPDVQGFITALQKLHADLSAGN